MCNNMTNMVTKPRTIDKISAKYTIEMLPETGIRYIPKIEGYTN